MAELKLILNQKGNRLNRRIVPLTWYLSFVFERRYYGRLIKKGHNKLFRIIGGRLVEITEVEDHPIFGKRYKILGCDEWFESNCFEVIYG